MSILGAIRSQMNRTYLEYFLWPVSSYASPSPRAVKWQVLARYGSPNRPWIETGTYMGRTTKFLAKIGSRVISIEADPQYASRAQNRFLRNPKIRIIHGESDKHIETALESVNEHVNFWLDAHYSGGQTFKGQVDTPIVKELEIIGRFLQGGGSASILIDDFRCFDPDQLEYSHYPSRSFLADWANEHSLKWTVEQDIFVAWTQD